MKNFKFLSTPKEPIIFLPVEIRERIIAVCKSIKTEIAWFQPVTVHDDRVYELGDIYIPEQEVSLATAEPTVAGKQKCMMAMVADGYEPDQMKCFSHSHVNMHVNPSGIDDQEFKLRSEQSNDIYIALIANTSGDFNVRMSDKVNNIVWEDLPVYSYLGNTDISDLLPTIENPDIIKPKVHRRPPQPSRPVNQKQANWLDHYNKQNNFAGMHGDASTAGAGEFDDRSCGYCVGGTPIKWDGGVPICADCDAEFEDYAMMGAS